MMTQLNRRALVARFASLVGAAALPTGPVAAAIPADLSAPAVEILDAYPEMAVELFAASLVRYGPDGRDDRAKCAIIDLRLQPTGEWVMRFLPSNERKGIEPLATLRGGCEHKAADLIVWMMDALVTLPQPHSDR